MLALLRPKIDGLPDVRAAIGAVLVDVLTPPEPVTVADWAASTRIVAAESGSPHPGEWSHEVAPYLIEVMECLTLSHPATEIVAKKGAQLGFSEAGLNLFGCIVDTTPCPILILLPSLDDAKTYVKLKLQPTIDATPTLAAKVREVSSRDEDGSTTNLKRYRGGFCRITGANSSKGLQMISVRVIIYEEVSEYPFDVDGRGDPVDQASARTDAYAGREKKFYCSTPALKGACRITAKYEASDQRLYYLPCPHCGGFQPLLWDNLVTHDPAKAHFVCIGNGCVIEHHHKHVMLARGVWIKSYDGPDRPPEFIESDAIDRFTYRDPQGRRRCNRSSSGRQPGFDCWQAYGTMKSWAKIAAEWHDAKGIPRKLKKFSQQVRAEPYEEDGEAPEWETLSARREETMVRGLIPPGALVLTAGVDVGKDYLAYEVNAWAPDKTSWSIEKDIIEGDTGRLEVWQQLTEKLYDRRFPDAAERTWPLDMIAVDSGYNTAMVYTWVRGRPRAIAIDGRGGRNTPVLGTPKKIDVSFKLGRKKRRALMLWPVGAWPLKEEFYAALRKGKRADDSGLYEPGYCHFGIWHDEEYFRQITAESLRRTDGPSGEKIEWVRTRANHFLDCRIYAMAALEHPWIAFSRKTPDAWAALARDRNTHALASQRDLLSGVPPSALDGAAGGAPDPAVPIDPVPIPPRPSARPAPKAAQAPSVPQPQRQQVRRRRDPTRPWR